MAELPISSNDGALSTLIAEQIDRFNKVNIAR